MSSACPAVASLPASALVVGIAGVALTDVDREHGEDNENPEKLPRYYCDTFATTAGYACDRKRLS
jgi:hypothetical protein